MKSTQSFGVRFIIRYSKNNLSAALIYARIIIDNKRTEISLNRTIQKEQWNSEKQMVMGSKELMQRINPFLDDTLKGQE